LDTEPNGQVSTPIENAVKKYVPVKEVNNEARTYWMTKLIKAPIGRKKRLWKKAKEV
jgi:hypothetical protein